MGIGIFFLVLFVLIIAALPIGGVFSFSLYVAPFSKSSLFLWCK